MNNPDQIISDGIKKKLEVVRILTEVIFSIITLIVFLQTILLFECGLPKVLFADY